MKTRFTFLLLIISFFVKAQQVNTVEYFFDTDPGFGNGMHININAASIDSTFDFNTGNLTAGLHSLVVRLKNSANKWSTIYQSNISINNGTAGPVIISAVEYFFDTDPGFGNGTQVNVNTATLDSTLNFNTVNLSQGVHTLFIRLKNSANVWSTVYQNSILINNGNAGPAAITTAEYFFDTDPGIGNGTLINLNNAAIDSTLKFSTTGLTPGAHTIFIRLKNNSNNWSFAYQGNFNVFNGIDSVPQIQSLSYFVDSVSNTQVIRLNKHAAIDTTLSIHVADNGTDKRVLGLRLMNQSGQTGNATLADISLCDLYKPAGLFRSVRFGNSYTFFDNSSFNPSKKIKWMVNNVADTSYNNSKIYNYNFPAGFHGSKTIVQITGTGCRLDTSYTEVVSRGIESITPDRGYIGNDLVMDIFGGDLDTTTQLYLQVASDAASRIYPFDKASYQNKMLSAIFDFHFGNAKSPTNVYDLHVHFADGYDTTILHAVIIGTFSNLNFCNDLQHQLGPTCRDTLEEDHTFVTADMDGPESVRLATWNYYTLNVTNMGSNLAKETPVWVIIPAQYDVKFDVDWVTPSSVSSIVPVDSLPVDYYQTIDTVINGHVYQYKLYGFIPPFIMPGQTLPITFKIRTSVAVPDHILYFVDKAMYGSPVRTAWLCAWDVAGYVPVAGCFTSVFDFFQSHGGFPPGYHSDFSHGILRGAAKDFYNGAYNIVGLGASCGGLKISAAKKVGAETIKKIAAWEGKLDKTIGTNNNSVLLNCRQTLEYLKEKAKPILSFFGYDPNHITGNNDYDSIKHYINNYSPQHYNVTFENLPAATANTQHVYILDTLQSSKFNFNTFKLTSFRIGDSSYVLPPSRMEMVQTVAIKGNNNLKVKFAATFDVTTGIMRCDFYSVDTTGNKLIPDTSFNGFLPPNSDGVSGTGSVDFSIAARNLNTLDTFSNKATIYFDANAPIKTNTWMNTVDTTAPTSKIIKAIRVNDSTAKFVVQQLDIGSGIDFNNLFVKSSTDSFFRNIGRAYGDTILFSGQLNQSYQLFSKATDNVGNVQYKDSVADISVTFPQGYVSSPTDYFRSVTSGDWNNIATWQSSPDNIIYNSATLTPDSSANTITIRNGHTVTVTANVIIDQTIVNPLGALIVTGSTLTVTNNGLKLQSDSSGTARIGNSSGTISGNVTVERYIPANNKRAWRLLSIPDVTNQTINAAWQNGLAKSIMGLSGIGTMITSNNNVSSFDFQTPGNSMLTYNSAADVWSGISATTLPIATDNAYFLFVRGDRTSTPLNNLITATTLSTTGTLKQGNYPASPIVVQASKFASLGNPYASQIDFRNVTKTAGVDNTFYVWDPKLTGSFGVGGYQTLTFNGSNYIITPGGGSYGLSGFVMNTIESGQGFLVHASAAGNVSFTESAKTSGSNMVFRTSNTPAESLITNIYSVESAGNALEDGTMNLFGNYSNAVDGNDALKLTNFGLNLSIAKENNFLTVEKRHPLTSADTIYFSLKNAKQQTYRFEFIANGLEHPGLSAWLVDNYLNTSTSVDLNGTTSVTFTVTASAASSAENRFVIIFSKPSSLLVYGKSSILVYPNPVQDGFIKLQLINMPKGNYSVRLANTMGQSVLNKQINHAEGTSTENIEVSKIKGIYMLELMKPDNSKIINKVIIN